MTEKERKLALYCLKANSDYHSEVCEECINYPNCGHTIQDDVTETIIKALEQEPCEDCISRKDTLAEFKRIYFDNDIVVRCAELVLGGMPPVTPQQKTGHWIHHKGNNLFDCAEHWECSQCHRTTMTNPFRVKGNDYDAMYYCPKCSAKMAESEG